MAVSPVGDGSWGVDYTETQDSLGHGRHFLASVEVIVV